MIDNGEDNVIIDRSLVTTSAMLQDLRKAKINNAYSLKRGMGEVWEVRIDADSINTENGLKISVSLKNAKLERFTVMKKSFIPNQMIKLRKTIF